MKKLDWLVLKAFIGPFILTTAVVVFILLIQQMMRYVHELLGKGLPYTVFAELMFYFSLHIVPLALPLGILLSTLITFGNLGEHRELTAIKSSGIALTRILVPIFIFTVFVTIASFWFNNTVVPEANLRAYSLLWDIRQKSPVLSIKEGAFYNGLPNYSIKVNQKFEDGESIKDVMIYDHTKGQGNREVILADSGRMYTIQEERYLIVELYNGNSYHDQINTNDGNRSTQKFVRNSFDKSQLVFSLASFDMDTTDRKLFSGHRIMKNIYELDADIDSIQRATIENERRTLRSIRGNYRYHLKNDTTLLHPNQKKALQNAENFRTVNNNAEPPKEEENVSNPPLEDSEDLDVPNQPQSQPAKDMVFNKDPQELNVISRALLKARGLRTLTRSRKEQIRGMKRQEREFRVELIKKYTLAIACLTMFLIGAPLGSIIKKGGLGIPVLISIVFFIIFYVISITGEKWVKEGLTHIIPGMWASNFCLFIVGLFFLWEARNDSRILESDFYLTFFKRIGRVLNVFSIFRYMPEVQDEL